MKSLTALKILQNVGIPVMETRDIGCMLRVSNAHASQILRRIAIEKHIIHLSRGFWVIDLRVNPLLLPVYLAVPFYCYVSLQTALYHHGMIDQIPRTITAVTLGRTRRIQTPIATISMHHIAPEFFLDFEMDPHTQVKMATPEKALVDILYLRPAKSLWFKNLPEIKLPKSFDTKKAFNLTRAIPSKACRTLVENALRTILSHPEIERKR